MNGVFVSKGFDKTDIVIEAVFEDLAVKHKVLRDLEQVEEYSLLRLYNSITVL